MLTHDNADNADNTVVALWRGARRHPERPCLTDLDRPAGPLTLTYDEVRGRVAALAGGLGDAGVRAGDRVALLMANSAEFVTAFLGVVAAGAVVVPLNTRLNAAEFLHMVQDSGSCVLITEDRYLQAFPALRHVEGLRVHSVTGQGFAAIEGAPVAEPVAPSPSGLMSLMYTSGTTGDPKAVMLSHHAWGAVAGTARSVLGVSAEDVVLHVAPLTHGAGFLVLPVLEVGGQHLLCGSYDAAATVRMIDEGRVTGMFLVPSMIRMLLDAAPEGWSAPPSFRWLYYAGSPIDPRTLCEAAQAFDGRIVQTFAQMESPMFLTALDRADHRRALADPDGSAARSAGRRLPGVEVEVVDAEGAALATGRDGEIVARSPQMMSGYWGREPETAATLVEGWLHTGDVGHFDDEGYLFVVDRLKDMIVTGGSNVYAREVEEVLTGLPGVRDAAVIGVPDRLWGEAVTAVLTSDNGQGDTAAVLAHCRSALPGYRVPKRVHWVEELPRNPYGKVLKRELRSTFSGSSGSDARH